MISLSTSQMFLLSLTIGFAYVACRSYYGNAKRLDTLEKRYCPNAKTERYQPQVHLLKQALSESWSWKGQRLAWMPYWCEAGEGQELLICLTELFKHTSDKIVYLGKRASTVAETLLRCGLEREIDPRPRVAMPIDLAELEKLLAEGTLQHPWLVAENAEYSEALAHLSRRYGCGVLLFCAECPSGYRALS